MSAFTRETEEGRSRTASSSTNSPPDSGSSITTTGSTPLGSPGIPGGERSIVPPTAGGPIMTTATVVPIVTTSILTPVEGRRAARRKRGANDIADTGSEDERGGGSGRESPETCTYGILRHHKHDRSRSSSTTSNGGISTQSKELTSSRSSVPGTTLDVFTQMKCGTLTMIVSSHVFSIVCSYFGNREDFTSLCLTNKRVRDASRYYSDHILINSLHLSRVPGIRLVRSVLVTNVGLWHYGRENFQDGLILFIPPPGAVEINPETHPIRSVYEDMYADHLSLRNTYELDYDSNGTQQKFRFSTAWLPTPRSAFNYFEDVRFLELMDFLNGLDWYLSFLDPVVMWRGSDARYGSPAPSTPNSTMSTFSESLLENFTAGPPSLSPNQNTNLLSGSQGAGPMLSSAYQRPGGSSGMRNQSSLVGLEEVRFVNCRVSMEDVKVCVQTQYAARRLVVVENNSSTDSYSCDSSPRRKTTTRGQRLKPTTVIPMFGDLWGTTSEKYTQIVDLARCNTQQLDDLLSVGTYLRRVVVRCLLVVDQSSLEAASHARLESLSLTGAPESAMREGSVELRGESFPSLRECILVGCPVTAIGPIFNSIELLHIAHCPIDTRAELSFPRASVVLEGVRLCSQLVLTCHSLTTCQVTGMDLKPMVTTGHYQTEAFTLVDVQHNSGNMVLEGSGSLGSGQKVAASPNHYNTTWPGSTGGTVTPAGPPSTNPGPGAGSSSLDDE